MLIFWEGGVRGENDNLQLWRCSNLRTVAVSINERRVSIPQEHCRPSSRKTSISAEETGLFSLRSLCLSSRSVYERHTKPAGPMD